MTILLFVLMLLALVVVHEFGHFVVAKLSGMKVPEFGVGFPPRLFARKIGETEYSVNAIPFGGFVKIHGEDVGEERGERSDPSSFWRRPKYLQAATLFAGPGMNLLAAFVLFSLAFMIGVPAAVPGAYGEGVVRDAAVVVVGVLPDSPAALGGIREGDRIVGVEANGAPHAIQGPDEIPNLVASTKGPVILSLLRGEEELSLTITPEAGLIAEEPKRKAIGIMSALVGKLSLPFFSALKAGFLETLQSIAGVASGIASLIGRALTFSADLSGVAGPVGIAQFVGSAATFGVGSLLSFAAIISINLGIINLLPFPALDGGRLAMLGAEVISGKRVPAKVASALNSLGFALLILLMLVVTINDISRLTA